MIASADGGGRRGAGEARAGREARRPRPARRGDRPRGAERARGDPLVGPERSPRASLATPTRPPAARATFIVAEIDRLTSVITSLLSFASPAAARAASRVGERALRPGRDARALELEAKRLRRAPARRAQLPPVKARLGSPRAGPARPPLERGPPRLRGGGEVALEARRRRRFGRDRRRGHRLRASLTSCATRIFEPFFTTRARAPGSASRSRARSSRRTAAASTSASGSGGGARFRICAARRARHDDARPRRRRRAAHGGGRSRCALGRAGYDVRDAHERRRRAGRARGARRRRGRDRLEDAGMDGLELLRRIRERRPGCPVILAHRARQRAVGGRGDARGRLRLRHEALRQRRAARASSAARSSSTRLERENRYLRQEVAQPLRPRRRWSPRARSSRELLDLRPPRRAEPRDGADPGRERHRQGAGGAPAALLERSRRPAVRRRQLQGVRRGRARERVSSATRRARSPAPRRLARRLLRARRRRHALPRRDRRGRAPTSRRSCCACCRTARCSASAATQPRPSTCAWSRATNRVLRDEVAAGRFREDLYFRLNVIPIQLRPAARAPRRHPAAGRALLPRAPCAPRRPPARAAPEAERAILEHGWPGNVRELENVDRARRQSLARGDTITPEDLLLEQTIESKARGGPEPGGTLQEMPRHSAASDRIRRRSPPRGQRARSPRALGVDRTTLTAPMRRLGLE